ncbi:MAG: sodium:alanine symporter family protein [Phoenicibacter congonensis]|uniref:Sodium:alanine symporter family protein n=1 Tax=Phoenicibacter congonensis TaxID=1944646 RepID=A0AA43UB19_9ACTN|nr:sodium:alanine symporter family protein [Phoenicibacter congonensis]
MEALIDVINAVDGFVWGPPMIIILLGTHLFLTVRTGGIQRKLFKAIKMSYKDDAEGATGDISQFGALCTTLAGTIGTGAIVGVGTAILAGGPGAVFWMWLTGVFGIATKYAEVYMAVKYRERDENGNIMGGTMVVFKRAFMDAMGQVPGWAKFGAAAFAFFCALATLGTGDAVQSQAITAILASNIPGVEHWMIGLVITIVVALVVVGGIKNISKVCELLVPFMALAYALGCIVILVMNVDVLWPALQMIVVAAFDPQAAFGGALGSGIIVAMQYGCARGLFSNESGLGTAPIVSSAAQTKNAAKQSLISMTGTFWSTVVMCLLTGIVITSSMIKYPGIISDVNTGTITAGAQLTNAAFTQIPVLGAPLLSLGIVTFALSTILGWYYYGDRCVSYLFGSKAVRVYQILYLVACMLGAVGVGDVVWAVSDIANALMAIPNLVAVWLLSGVIAKETKYYVWEGHLEEQDKMLA